ncbi:HNH endonuclease [Salmonella enterica subsp. enterica serovar Bareilly]|nr:HNH endonuclease [Salmonella enterica subsp. enterica serovar Bareilly]
MCQLKNPAPPEILKELMFYEDGNLYWTPEAREANKQRKPGPIGYVNKNGYREMCFRDREVKGKQDHYMIHRLIYWWHTGEWPEMVDHADGNKLNNYPDNLRAATRSQNKRNSVSAHSSTTPYIGVHRAHRNYRITISIEGKQYTKGGYATAEAAALARDMLANLFYGDFASYSFLDKPGLVVGGITI